MRPSANLAVLQLLALVSKPCAGLADPKQPSDHWVSPILQAASHALTREEASDSDQVMMTAGGNMQRPSTMMRRHERREEDIFKAFDVNEDGIASAEEVKALFQQGQQPIPEDFSTILSSIDGNHDGSISYDEFIAATQHAAAHKHKREKLQGGAAEARHHRHHHHRQSHRTGRKHEMHDLEAAEKDEASPHKEEALLIATNLGKELMIEDREKAKAAQAAEAAQAPGDDDSWVTCGGHKAPTCAACVSTDSNGRTVFDHGSEWCHGDCVYHKNKCHKQGTVTVDGTTAGGISQGYATTPIPDLFNPNMTSNDERTVDLSAEAAIREENLEAAEKAKQEEEALESKKFSWSKFWLISCITASVILGICAIVSICALVVLYCAPTASAKGDPDDDGEEGGAYKQLSGDEANKDEKAGDGDGKPAEATADAPAEDPPKF